MSDLPPDVQSVLRAARSADEPTHEDFTRVRHALATTLAAASITSITSTATGAKAAGSAGTVGGSAGVTLKVIGVALAVTAAAGGIAAWQLTAGAPEAPRSAEVVADRGASDRAPVPAPPVSTAEARIAGGTPGQAPAEPSPAGVEPAGDAPDALPKAPPASNQAPPRAAAAGIAPRDVSGSRGVDRQRIASSSQPTPGRQEPDGNEPQTKEAAPEARDSEVTLMTRASQALGQKAPGTALEWLQQHAERFPDGVLAPERRALRVIALCQQGQREAGTAFLRQAPRSPLAARVRAACGTLEEE